MAIDQKETISCLNVLIETCKDGEKGFRTAAEAIEAADLKNLLQGFSQQRAEFARDIQQVVSKLGGSPETSGSVTGAVHRGWINIKQAVTGHDAKAIISECERGEDSAVKAYGDALKGGLPADVLPIVERQFAAVKQAHDQIRSLEKSHH